MQKTPLHQIHQNLGAKMGEFAGYDMPLYYKDGVLKEHEWVRSHAGLFDVSHMGQIIIEGKNAAEFLEKITPSSFRNKAIGRAQYTVLTNEEGGIIDDLIVTRVAEDKFYAVINAGFKQKDIDWITKQTPIGVYMMELKDRSLIAIQGPWSERIIHETLGIEAGHLGYMEMMSAEGPLFDELYISRLGYTGEDGYEISVPNVIATDTWEYLENHPEIRASGLAARDALRLEMGYCLSGHDIDETTSPVEAGLEWVMSKNNTGFIGAARVLAERENGPAGRRTGFKLLGKGVMREGMEILDGTGAVIGKLTSGGYSPTLDGSIGMGYLPTDMAQVGSKVAINMRGRAVEAEIVSMPFIQPKTKSKKKSAA